MGECVKSQSRDAQWSSYARLRQIKCESLTLLAFASGSGYSIAACALFPFSFVVENYFDVLVVGRQMP